MDNTNQAHDVVSSQMISLLGAVRFTHDEPVDLILEAVVRQLKADGFRVTGYLQREAQDGDGCCSPVQLENIADGRMFHITQPLGSGSRGCRLDPQALANRCGPLSKDLDEGVDILVLNRFGRGESEGQGFRAVIEEAFQKGIPVLVAVRDPYVDAWHAFGGVFAEDLPANEQEIVDWCRRAKGIPA